MNTQMFLEDGATGRLIDEGASARIFEYTHYPTHYVVKQQKRQARNSTHPPAFQQKIQQWSYEIVKPPNFTLLRVPAAFEISTSSKATAYVMERIDTSQPITLQEENQPPQLVKELLLYYFLCSQQGYFPNDYEIYKQPDGISSSCRIVFLVTKILKIFSKAKYKSSILFQTDNIINTMDYILVPFTYFAIS